MAGIIRVKDHTGEWRHVPAFVGAPGPAGPAGADGPAGPAGPPGQGFAVLGYYDTLGDLEAAVPDPAAGDAYGVGAEAPYNIYIWDGVNEEWVDNGTIQGPPGQSGQDGKSVELQKTSTNIQWRRVGDSTWTDLVALSELKGAGGDPGADGREVEIQTTATHIQWRLTGGMWANLVALADLKGAPGTDGDDGREIELQKGTTYIQWRYVGTGTWNNLVALADLKGDPGTPGEDATGYYGTCSTAAGTAEKTSSISGFTSDKLVAGVIVGVRFTNGNTNTSATLNISSTGAKSIRVNNAAISATHIVANMQALFQYDGTYWNLLNPAGAAAHASTHASGGADPITPANIGAVPTSGGTMTGTLVAGGTQNLATAQVRNIIASTTDLTPGVSALATGTLYIVYEV
jgi:hypothetical protein